MFGDTEYDTTETEGLDLKNSEANSNGAIKPKLERKIKVFDRFSIILQIFAQRAISKIARLQIQLSFIGYIRSRINKDSKTAISHMFNIFEGDLLNAKEISLEVVNAKQRRTVGKLTGQGESQLELEKRILRDREVKIRREIQDENDKRKIQLKSKARSSERGIPSIALVNKFSNHRLAIQMLENLL